MSDNIENSKIEEESIKSIQELNPQELENVFKVVNNIPYYDEVYSTITKYILARYGNINLDKVNESGDIIDKKLSGVSFGERLLIYNKLDEPFINEIWKEYKFLMPGKRDPLKEINDMILALHPYIKIKNINNLINKIDIQIDSMDLRYEEKFLLYNNLAHAYLRDMKGYSEIT